MHSGRTGRERDFSGKRTRRRGGGERDWAQNVHISPSKAISDRSEKSFRKKKKEADIKKKAPRTQKRAKTRQRKA